MRRDAGSFGHLHYCSQYRNVLEVAPLPGSPRLTATALTLGSTRVGVVVQRPAVSDAEFDAVFQCCEYFRHGAVNVLDDVGHFGDLRPRRQ